MAGIRDPGSGIRDSGFGIRDSKMRLVPAIPPVIPSAARDLGPGAAIRSLAALGMTGRAYFQFLIPNP